MESNETDNYLCSSSKVKMRWKCFSEMTCFLMNETRGTFIEFCMNFRVCFYNVAVAEAVAEAVRC